MSESEPSDPPPRRAVLVIFMIVAIDLTGFWTDHPPAAVYGHAPQDRPFQVTDAVSVYSIFQFIGVLILGIAERSAGTQADPCHLAVGQCRWLWCRWLAT